MWLGECKYGIIILGYIAFQETKVKEQNAWDLWTIYPTLPPHLHDNYKTRRLIMHGAGGRRVEVGSTFSDDLPLLLLCDQIY